MQEIVEEVWRKYRNCQECPLSETRKNIVFGTGNTEADLMFVLDTPSLAQDKTGNHGTSDLRWLVKMYKRVTKSKKKLDSVARDMFQNVFVVSATMCAPIHTEGDLVGQRRKPKPIELRSCRPRLLDQIYAIDPKVIIAFGPSARKALFAGRTGIDITGTVLEYVDVPSKCGIDTLRYSVLTCSGLIAAEIAGDYHFAHGKTASVENAITKALHLIDLIDKEDRP